MKKLLILISLLVLLPLPFVYADNSIQQIIKVTGTKSAGVQNADFTISPAINDITKTVIFMSVRHIGDSDEKEQYNSWEIINPTTLRFYGSSNTPANNNALTFVAYIVEFTSASDMTSQQGFMTIAGGQANQEFTDSFTAVNTATSFYQFLGQTANHADLTWGQEEIARMRIISSTSFGYEPFDAPNSGPTDVRYQIIDLNNVNVLVQRGIATMPPATALLTVTPPTAINGSRTMLFASHMLNSGLDAEVDTGSFTARIDGLNRLEFDRDDPDTVTLNIRWETITFLDGSVYVQYRQFDDTTATGADVQQTGVVDFVATPVVFANSFATGTVHTPLGLGQAREPNGPQGGWDRVAYTVELIDADTVSVVTNDGASLADVWFQVVQFNNVGAVGDINRNIQQQPSCCFFFLKPIIDLLKSAWSGFILLINSFTVIMAWS